ncbi:MAG: F0F1 ATP synthase subunit delta [Verrucomicrobia bacterium]|nr:F0F1 ATP synthase subunit delta [Verrucomicrobiota bacterium]
MSKQAKRDAKSLFRNCQINGILDEKRVLQTVDEVLKRKPRGFGAILSHFQRLIKLDEAARTAKIESATALTPDLQNNYKEILTKRYGQGLYFIFQENPGLLGGVRVQVGSDVFDGTVRARLNELNESFKAA